MPDEEVNLVGEAAAAAGSASGQGERAAAVGRSRDQTTESSRSVSGGSDRRRPSVYRDEAVLPALLRMIRKKFGKRFQETRDIVIFVTLVAFAAVYLVVSSKLILDYLEIPGAKDASNVSAADESPVRYTFPPGCVTAAGIGCLPEAMYLEKHIDKATTCSDFFGSVCNDNYFYSAERKDSWLWPYRYSNLYHIYNALQRAVRVDYQNFVKPVEAIKEDALYKTLYFLKNCTSAEDRAKVNIGHLKRTLALIGLPSSPYSSLNESILPDTAQVLASVMRNLNVYIFFVVNVEIQSTKIIELRKLPANHKAIERHRSNIATEHSEFIYYFLKTRHLMEPHGKLYEYITKDFYELSLQIALERGKMVVTEPDQLIDIRQLPTGSAAPASGTQKVFNWLLFFQTLFPNTAGFTFTNTTKITVKDHAILVSVMKIIQSKPRHIVLNYIMLVAWYFVAPLLPDVYLRSMSHLPDDHYILIGDEMFLPSCVKLAERFCPAGMAVALLTKVMNFNDFQSAVNWGAPVVEIYRKYMKAFIDGIEPLIPGTAAKTTYFTTTVPGEYLVRPTHIGILPQYKDPITDLQCNVPIRTTSTKAEDDVVLLYFINAIKKNSNDQWDLIFNNRTAYSPDISNLEFQVHFRKELIFVPLVYAAPILVYPKFRETYIIMSLGDYLKAFLRALFYDELTTGGQTFRGRDAIAYAQSHAQEIWNEFATFAAVNRTSGGTIDADHSWFLGELLVAKYIFRILDQVFNANTELISNGLPGEYKRMMKYILFAEAACRYYKEIPITAQTIYYYGMPPRDEHYYVCNSDQQELKAGQLCPKKPRGL